MRVSHETIYQSLFVQGDVTPRADAKFGHRPQEVGATDNRGGVPRRVLLGERIGHHVFLDAVDPIGEWIA